MDSLELDGMDLSMPDSLGSAGGAMQLSAADDARRTQQLKAKKNDSCCWIDKLIQKNNC